MKKFVNSDDAFTIIDKLFAEIQKNGYFVNQEMLDETWKEWIKLPNAFNTFEVVGRLNSLAEESEDGKLSLKDVIEILSDEEQNGDSRICKFCGKSRKDTIVFPVLLNGERIYSCQDCISKQEDVQQIGFDIPLDDVNPKADKKMTFYVHFLKPELFGNAEYAKVEYRYEKEMELKKFQMKVKLDFITSALDLKYKDVLEILADENHERFAECKELYDSIEFISKEEYKKD